MRRWKRLAQSTPGHPLYVPLDRQGAGRFDNPGYAALYTATEPAAAVGETFGNRHTWGASMLTHARDGMARALVTLEADVRLVDLTETSTLDQLSLQPSDVGRRNQDRTREIALCLWLEDHRRIHGLRWWSYYRPEWQLVMLWSREREDSRWFRRVQVIDVETLDLGHPTVRLAAAVLPRRLDNR